MQRLRRPIPDPGAGYRRRIGATIMVLALGTGASAAVVERMDVVRDGERFAVDAAIRLSVPRVEAYAAATRYERLPDFNPAIQRSERRGEDELVSRLQLCVALFCRTIDQVMRYREQAPRRISMQVVPAAGDLKAGTAEWRFEVIDAATTRLWFNAEIEPDFWVPPVIGGYLVARELRRQARTTAESIERLIAAEQSAHVDPE